PRTGRGRPPPRAAAEPPQPAEPLPCRRARVRGAPEPGHLFLMTEPRHLALRVPHGFLDDITLGRVDRLRAAADAHRLAIADRAQRTQIRPAIPREDE